MMAGDRWGWGSGKDGEISFPAGRRAGQQLGSGLGHMSKKPSSASYQLWDFHEQINFMSPSFLIGKWVTVLHTPHKAIEKMKVNSTQN
jgi:hypothetical protein